MALQQVRQRQQQTDRRITIAWLNNDVDFWLLRKLIGDVGKLEMTSTDDREDAVAWNQSLSSAEGRLQHRAVAEKFHVLFRQRIASKSFDKGAQSDAFSGGQDDRATIFQIGSTARLVKHVFLIEQYGGHCTAAPQPPPSSEAAIKKPQREAGRHEAF